MQSQIEIRQDITNKIIESLKAGRIPWRKPWTGIDGPRTPTNFVTLRRYSGINIPILWAASQERGYDLDFFGTFNQWKSIGASIKKGAKAIHVVLFKPIKKVVKQDDGTERTEQFPILRVFPVFSIHEAKGEAVEKSFNRPVGAPLVHEKRVEFERVVAASHAVSSLASTYWRAAQRNRPQPSISMLRVGWPE